MPKTDMTLGVNVNVTGSIDGSGVLTATATYTQGASNPPSTGVVDAGGDIDLTKMNDQGNDFNNQTDITFMLSGNVTDQGGTSYPVRFLDTVGASISIQKKNGGPPSAGEFNPALVSTTSLLVDDANTDGQDYRYCLTIEPDGLFADTPTCPLDPNIVNR